MKKTFTVRLPIKAEKGTRHRITQRIHADSGILASVLDSLAGSGIPISSRELMPYAMDRLRDLSQMLGGADPEAWVSNRIACVYQALNDYRAAVRYAEKKMPGGFNKRNVQRVVELRRKSVDIYAPINKKAGLSADVPWEDLEPTLLDLIFTGKGRVPLSVDGVGDFEVAGAGKRERGEEAFIAKTMLENRGERYYLSVEVSHKVDQPQLPRINGPEAINIVFTSGTWVADDRGVSLTMLPDAKPVIERRKVAQKAHRDGDSRLHRVAARKSMDARHNFIKQYAARVTKYARENRLVIVVAPREAKYEGHPYNFGDDKRQRAEVVDEIFRQCRARGLSMIVSDDSSTNVRYQVCGHKRAWVGLLGDQGKTVRAMCEDCSKQARIG